MMAKLTAKSRAFHPLLTSAFSAIDNVYCHALLEIFLSFNVRDLVLAYVCTLLSSLSLEGSCLFSCLLPLGVYVCLIYHHCILSSSSSPMALT